MWPPLSKVTAFFCFFLQYDEVFLSSLLNGCYHYLDFMDPVNDYSESKLLVKSDSAMSVSCNFCYPCVIL